MAFLRLDPKSKVWYIVDKRDRANPWKRLGKDRLEIDKSDARQALRRYQKESNYLRLNLPLPGREISFSALVQEFLEHRKHEVAPRTYAGEKGLLGTLEKAFGKRQVTSISTAEIKTYLSEKKYKPNSVHKIVHALRKVWQYAIDRKYIGGEPPVHNPMLDVPIPTIERGLPRPLEEEVQQIIFGALDGLPRAFYLLLRNTGARPSEAKRLRVRDGWQEGVAITKTKTATPRLCPWTDELRKVWKDLAAGKGPDDLLFGGQENFRSALDRALREINAARKKKKQPLIHATPYQLRHSYATRVYNATGDLMVVKELLGHASLETTQIYAQVLSKTRENAVKKAFSVSRGSTKRNKKQR